MKRNPDPIETYSRPILANSSKSTSTDDCEGKSFTTDLKNITPSFHHVKVGENMRVLLEEDNILVCYNLKQEYCGNIASFHNGSLILCAKKGKSIMAKKLSLEGSLLVFVE